MNYITFADKSQKDKLIEVLDKMRDLAIASLCVNDAIVDIAYKSHIIGEGIDSELVGFTMNVSWNKR